jgi:hypothetical protein
VAAVRARGAGLLRLEHRAVRMVCVTLPATSALVAAARLSLQSDSSELMELGWPWLAGGTLHQCCCDCPPPALFAWGLDSCCPSSCPCARAGQLTAATVYRAPADVCQTVKLR